MNTALFPARPAVERHISTLRTPIGFPAPDVCQGAQAVFLHTGWRSGGTWIWSRCREFPQVHGYYEPLHEHAARFRRHDVATLRPGSWKSNHSDTAPYFEEYRDLIPPRGRGVSSYQTRFAFEGFFRAPGDPADPQLESYLTSLLAPPVAQGRVPVLKFCRSMGRVGWFERRFPEALHAVVLRDPIAQFRSGERLHVEQRNRYFVLAPLLVLARNAQHPSVRAAALALGVNVPTLFSDDLDYAVETVWSHVRRATPAERYRGFLAFWTLCARSALESGAMVIDVDAIGDDPEHRRSVELALQARIGEPIALTPRLSSARGSDTLPCGWREAHNAAAAFVAMHHGALTPERRDIILKKLGDDEGVPPVPPSWHTPYLPDPQTHLGTMRSVTTWAEIRLARAMQPLRRFHGSLAKQGVF